MNFSFASYTPDDPPADLTPAVALMIYQAGQDISFMRHPVSVEDHKPTIGAGIPMNTGHLAELVSILQSHSAHQCNNFDVLSPNILSLSPGRLAWVIPAAIRPMWFRVGGKTPFSLTVPWPRLLVGVSGDKLFVAAIKGNRRPTANTPIYHAPLMNVYEGFDVCQGTADRPGGVGLEQQGGWESVLFDTAFSHVNHAHTLYRKDGKDVSSSYQLAFWRELHRKQATRFPNDRLMSGSMRLRDFLRLLV